MKRKKDIKDYSANAFLTNPPASPSEWTGYVPTPAQGKAQSLADLMDVPVDDKYPKNKKQR